MVMWDRQNIMNNAKFDSTQQYSLAISTGAAGGAVIGYIAASVRCSSVCVQHALIGLPVVEIGAVGEILAAQLTWLPDVSQAGHQLRLHRVVLAHLVEFLPGLAPPVGTDVLAHLPAGRARVSETPGPSALCHQEHNT